MILFDLHLECEHVNTQITRVLDDALFYFFTSKFILKEFLSKT